MQEEHKIQKAFFDWIRATEEYFPVLKLMFAVPNAAKRSYKLAAMLKAEGLRKGVLDVIFPVSRQGFTGLAIEFKTPGKKLTPEQEEFAEMLKLEGWKTVVFTNPESAIDEVKRYAGIP